MTDLSTLEVGKHVAVMAKVNRTDVVHGGRNRPSRLEVTLTDGNGYLAVTFFGREHLVEYWQRELAKGVRGIFVGKVGQFRDQAQLTHPEFVMLDASGAIVGSSEKKQLIATMSRSALVGMYPATAKLPTWKVAECCRLALATLSGDQDPWPEWVLDAADVMPLADAFACVHQPHSLAEAHAGTQRLLFDEAFATQLTMAYRRADASTHTAIRRRASADGLLAALDARLPFGLTEGQRIVERHAVRRTRPGASDATAAAGGGRLGQDSGGAAGHAGRHRRGRPVRVAGSHRGVGAAALRHHPCPDGRFGRRTPARLDPRWPPTWCC